VSGDKAASPVLSDLSWVERTEVIDAIDTDARRALDANPGWRLLHVGSGSGGQTTLTYGWPWTQDNTNSKAASPVLRWWQRYVNTWREGTQIKRDNQRKREQLATEQPVPKYPKPIIRLDDPSVRRVPPSMTFLPPDNTDGPS
jgi:hypothetical protein